MILQILLHCFILKGEILGTTEATEAFFAMTKLFQSKDVVLRRMVYLGIKELATIAEDVIIVTSSLTKDMTGKEDTYRAPAIRALTAITDVNYFSVELLKCINSLLFFIFSNRIQCCKQLNDT
jgi:hypothetical protein